jgi:transposase
MPIPLPIGLLLDAASWEQTPLVVRQLVVQLLAIIQQQAARITALEARMSRHSSNSDRPPSSDPPYEKRTARTDVQGNPGAKPGHPGHRQALLAPTEVIEVRPETCACGQREFPATTPYHTHQVIELPEIQMAVTHVVLHETQCSQCGRRLKAELPAEYRYGYGPRLTALIGELSGSQRDSRSTVQEFCRSVLGVPMSRGAIQRTVDRVSEAIKPHYGAIAGKARSAKVNYIDETAWYQHGVLSWLWVMVNTTVALFKIQASRNKEAFAALIERWAGILVSNGYAVYCQWVHRRQTCLTHLIRRARGLSDRQDPEQAWFGRRVMTELQRLVHWATVPPTSGEVQTWYARMVHLIDQYGARGGMRRERLPVRWSGKWAPYGRLWWKKESSPRITGRRGHSGLRCSGARSCKAPTTRRVIVGSSGFSHCGRRAACAAGSPFRFWCTQLPAPSMASIQMSPGSDALTPLNAYNTR